LTRAIVEYLKGWLGSDALVVGIVSAIPVIEVRGAVPLAFAGGMPPAKAFFYSLAGSVAIIPFLLLFFYPVLNALKKIKFIKRFALALEALFAQKAHAVYEKSLKRAQRGEINKLIALAAFVAVPLPMTGVWSGCAVAGLLNIKFFPALISILIGDICSALIMTLLSWLFFDALDYILSAFLAAALLTALHIIVKAVISGNAKKRET
jgi:uncharacterized membrane protein